MDSDFIELSLDENGRDLLRRITCTLLVRLGADPDCEILQPLFAEQTLFAEDLSEAKETIDFRLVAAAKAAHAGVHHFLQASFSRGTATEENALYVAWNHLGRALDAEFKAANPEDWQPHQILKGVRKGQAVWKNVKTGSLRDDPPHETPKKSKKKPKGDDGDSTPPPDVGEVTKPTPKPEPEIPKEVEKPKEPESKLDPVVAGKMQQIQAQIQFGFDPGYKVSRDVKEWARHPDTTPEQTRQLAETLGVPVKSYDDKKQMAYDIYENLKSKLTHPGGFGVEKNGMREILERSIDGTGIAFRPDLLASATKHYGADQIDYLSRSVGLAKAGDSEISQRQAITDAATKAYEKAGQTAQAEKMTERIKAMYATGKSIGSVETVALRQELHSMQDAELAAVYKGLGLAKPGVYLYGADYREKIMDTLSISLKNQMAGDTATAGHIAAMAGLFSGEYQKQAEIVRVAKEAMAVMVKQGALDHITGDKYFSLKGEAGKAQEVMRAMTESHRQALYKMLKPAKAATFEVEAKKGTGPKQKEAAAGAVEFFKKTLSVRPGDPPILAKINVANTKSRAFALKGYGNESKVALTNASVGTAVHEFGHVIEFSHPGVLKLAHDFYKLRGLDQEASVSFKKKFPGLGYKSGESGKKDNFDKYFGDTSAAYYCGKTYPGGSTELISMGMEHLYRDPAGFCAKDPEYAGFIIGILKGTIR